MDTRNDAARSALFDSSGRLLVVGYTETGPNWYQAVTLARFKADGSLDPTFGTAGRALTSYYGGYAIGHALALQEDGKIVVGGRYWSGTFVEGYNVTVNRYTTGGVLDTTFGSEGTARIDVAGGADFLRALQIQTDGKIWFSGYAQIGTDYDLFAGRLLTDGTLDSAVDTDGLVAVSVGTEADRAYAMILDTSGKPVLIGATDNGTNDDVFVVRFLTDGTLDTTFSGDGIDTWAIGSGNDQGWALAEDENGRIVATGRTYSGTNHDFFIAEWDNTGSQVTVKTYSVGTAADVGRALLVGAGGFRTVIGRSWIGTNWSFSMIRTTNSAGPDADFGVSGAARIDVSDDDFIHRIALQTDGKILAGGKSRVSDVDFLLVRLLTTGSLDTTFHTDGATVTDIGTDDTAFDLFVQDDGKILLGGFTEGATFDFAVVRYATDGTLDNTFETDGLAVTSIGTGADVVNSLQQDSARIYAVGQTYNGTDYDFAIAAYTTTGALDATFHTDGIVVLPVGSADDNAHRAILNGNKLIITGAILNGSNWLIGVVRLNTNGTFDNTFETDGIAFANFDASGDGTPYALALQTDGKILVGGNRDSASYHDFAVVRFLTNGGLDNTFDTDGMVSLDIDTAAGATLKTLAIDTDAKIVVGGYTTDIEPMMIVAKLNTDGSLDTNFGSAGIVQTDVGAGGDLLFDLLVDNSGKVVGGGTAFNSTYDVALTRYSLSGALDVNFGTNGILTQRLGTTASDALGYAVNGNRLTVVGRSRTGTYWDFALLRMDLDAAPLAPGILDDEFDTDGIVSTQVSATTDIMNKLISQPDGKIVMVGASSDTDNKFMVVRYLTDGTLDLTFDTDGIALTDVGASQDDATSVVLDTTGKLVVSGYSVNAGNKQFAVVRYNSNGSLDGNFETDGVAITVVAGGGDDLAYDLVLQEDGKIVLAGHSHTSTRTDVAFVRYLTNGSLDSGFDTDGIVTVPLDTINGAQIHAVEITTEGAIIGAGRTLRLENEYALARLLTDGSLDSTFDTDGMAIFDITAGDDIVYDMKMDSQGRVVLIGQGYGSTFDVMVTRLTAAGVLDTSFGTGGGSQLLGISGNDEVAYAVVLDDSERILVTGSISGRDVLVARFNSDGTVESGFGTGGAISFAVGSNDDIATGLALDASGNIIVGGYYDKGTEWDLFYSKLLP